MMQHYSTTAESYHYGYHDVDPIKAAILRSLWEAAQDADGKLWSLAKLSKRSGVPMSTLMRNLTQFEMAGIVDVSAGQDGRSFASLSETGIEVFPQLFTTQ
jgi:DNA-binding MarR family transcriptional regulator